MPLTIHLDTHKVAIAAVKLCTFDDKMEIDAVMLSSGPGSSFCSGCQPLLYRIQRQPPFTSTSLSAQTQQTFTDSSVIQGVKYQYTIQVEADGLLSHPSPPLIYTHGQPYCGDGLTQGMEECDDRNLLDGEQYRRKTTILLSDANGKNHSIGTHDLSCHRNPLVVNVTHDLSQPFFLTSSVILLFSSPFVAVRGVALRTSCHFSTFALTGCPWGTTFGKQCSFTCGPPAILQGDSDRLVCLEDGLWSFPEAYCKIECPEGLNISNAKLLTPQCVDSGHHVGSVCRYKCNPGFYVVGSLKTKTPRKYFKLECLEDGQWEENNCEPISCPALHNVFQGLYSCTNGLHYNTRCTLQCPDASENMEIRCAKDGKWTAEFTMCSTLQGSCSSPPDLHSVEYSCDQGMEIGDVCYPTCAVVVNVDLHDPVVLPSGVTVDALKHWMLPNAVQSIVCTGLMKWYPDPRNIHCIPSCEPFGGDGWCDTINNRAYCQYDGGDCCPSTLSTRKVIQFGADCSEDECTCRDPDAEENKSRAKHLDGEGGAGGRMQ
uniref:Pappalysin 2 n=1 Tax=Nothobranchius kadleci TaxID=1051664 RepID=A0A1A8C286_NOTKA